MKYSFSSPVGFNCRLNCLCRQKRSAFGPTHKTAKFLRSSHVCFISSWHVVITETCPCFWLQQLKKGPMLIPFPTLFYNLGLVELRKEGNWSSELPAYEPSSHFSPWWVLTYFHLGTFEPLFTEERTHCASNQICKKKDAYKNEIVKLVVLSSSNPFIRSLESTAIQIQAADARNNWWV